MNMVPFLKLRVSEEEEMQGLDRTQMGEYAFEALTEKERSWSSSVDPVSGQVVQGNSSQVADTV